MLAQRDPNAAVNEGTLIKAETLKAAKIASFFRQSDWHHPDNGWV
jgi:hypothetical protein